MWGMWGGVAASTTCPNCGHNHYKEKDPCERCGFLKPDNKKLPDAYFIFCKNCGCSYASESGQCPLHGADSVERIKLPEPKK